MQKALRLSSKSLAVPLLGAVGTAVLMLPGARRLPKYGRTELDGIVNINDAVAACRRSGLQDWELVAYAQQLVARKFSIYSTLNLWDPPGRAFIYGAGYCTQYNLALKRLLDRLGQQTEAVFAVKTRIFDNPDWAMGHTWLRVTINGETRDVCAGRVSNTPGHVNFTPLSQVHTGHPFTLFLTHLGLIFFAGFLEWKALLTGSEPPAWAYREKNTQFENEDS
jgi:hypothetical protein